MRKGDRRVQTGLIALSAVSMFLVPIAVGPLLSPAYTSGSPPYVTVPPPNATFPPPFVATPPVVTPISTIGPGQYFEEGDEDQLPDVARPDLLEDEAFGYSAILGKDGLYLFWSIDDDGMKHYYALEDESDFFQRAQKIVDDNLTARRELDATNPLLSLVWAGTKAVVGEVRGAPHFLDSFRPSEL